MHDHRSMTPRGWLDPLDRISEILFGLIMALTITNSLGIAQHGDADIKTLLAGALGCNLAWGAIDAAMYLMVQFSDRSRAILSLESLRRAAEGSEARRIIAEALPPVVASALREDDLDRIDQRLRALPNLSKQPLRREDWLAAIGVFLLVFLSTFPVVIPFMFVGNAWLALRISNAVAVGMLFLSGYALGRHSGTSPWKVGLAMIALGVMLVLVALALGG